MLEEIDIIRLKLSLELLSRAFQATTIKIRGAIKPNFIKV